MGIVATKRWSDSSLSQSASQGWVARESWVVTGTTNKVDAMNAAVHYGDFHPLSPSLTCSKIEARAEKGPQSWIVSAEYTMATNVEFPDDPLKQPPKIYPDLVFETIPTDYTLDATPVKICNSAGDPFDPPATKTIIKIVIQYVRAEPYWDISKSYNYSDRVSSKDVSIKGVGLVPAGNLYCRSIKPADGFTTTARYVWMAYTLELVGGYQPFQLHVADKGRWGWYNDSGTSRPGRICNKNGIVADMDVMLDGAGRPIDSKWYILPDNNGTTPKTPVSNPSAPAGLLEDPATQTSSTVTVLVWNNKYTADLNLLSL